MELIFRSNSDGSNVSTICPKQLHLPRSRLLGQACVIKTKDACDGANAIKRVTALDIYGRPITRCHQTQLRSTYITQSSFDITRFMMSSRVSHGHKTDTLCASRSHHLPGNPCAASKLDLQQCTTKHRVLRLKNGPRGSPAFAKLSSLARPGPWNKYRETYHGSQ